LAVTYSQLGNLTHANVAEHFWWKNGAILIACSILMRDIDNGIVSSCLSHTGTVSKWVQLTALIF